MSLIMEMDEFSKSYTPLKPWDLTVPIQTRMRFYKDSRTEFINGCFFPKEGRSYFDPICACGQKKLREDYGDHDIFLCKDCDLNGDE